MNSFISVTSFTTGEKVYINTLYIYSIYKMKEDSGCIVRTIDGRFIVRESVDEVTKLIEDENSKFFIRLGNILHRTQREKLVY